jgi:hypothetical protein
MKDGESTREACTLNEELNLTPSNNVPVQPTVGRHVSLQTASGGPQRSSLSYLIKDGSQLHSLVSARHD